MATFVDTCTEEEQLQSLVQYVSNLKKKATANNNSDNSNQFLNDCTTLVQERKNRDALVKIIGEQDSIFSEQGEKDVESVVNVLSALIRKLDTDTATSLAQKLCEAVATNTSDRPLLRLKILTNIYQAFDVHSSARYNIFMTLAKYAHESGNSEMIIPKLKQLDKWLSDWNANPEQANKLYKLLHQMLKDSNRSAQAHKYFVKYIQSIEKGKESTPEYITIAAEAVLESIQLPEIFQFDHLLALPSVQALQNNNNHATLYKLLKIFAVDKTSTFEAFVKENPTYLKSAGIDHEAALRKIRLLSLASLGNKSREISYSDISANLSIPEDEVEDWVISGVSAHLFEAKMNQLKRTVAVGYCLQREFGTQQWESLSVQLKRWQSSIRQLVSVVEQVPQIKAQ